MLPSHDYHVNQCVAYQNQDNPSKQWYPATITSLCADRNCQSIQYDHMQPVKLAMTQASHIWSVKPAMPQTMHIQSVKASMPEASPMQPVKVIEQSNHKKSQVQPVSAQSTHMWSSTQPEVIRNSDKHAVLHTQASHVGQPITFQDSTSKCCYPAVNKSLCPDSRSCKITTMWSVNPLKIHSTHMWPVKAELQKKSQVSTKS